MKILVTGATGQQGGAVVDHLRAGEFGHHEIYGLTRDLSSPGAHRLVDRGALPVEGDMRDYDRLVALLSGVDGVFLVTTPFESGPDAETEQGTTVAEAAAAAGVSHVVYSSVEGADRADLPFFRSKLAVEERIRELDLPATVLRPAYFVQNFAALRPEIRGGSLPLPLSPTTALHLVDVEDVGRAAAAAFADPDRFLGETVALAGDARSVDEMAAVFADTLGRPVEARAVPPETYRTSRGDAVADMYAWFEAGGYDAPRPDLSRFGLTLRTLAESLAVDDVWTVPSTPVDNPQ